jgi:hypothetical protein
MAGVTDTYTLEQAEADIANNTGAIDRMTEAIPLMDGPIPNVLPASGCTLYSAAGNLDFEGFDGNEYATGRCTVYGPTTGQVITSGSSAPIAGMSFGVQAGGVYRIRAKIGCLQGGGAFGQNIMITHPGLTFASGFFVWWLGGSGDSGTVNQTSNTASPYLFTSPAFAAAATFWLDLDAIVQFSATGPCAFAASEGTATHSFTVNPYAFADIEPVS